MTAKSDAEEDRERAEGCPLDFAASFWGDVLTILHSELGALVQDGELAEWSRSALMPWMAGMTAPLFYVSAGRFNGPRRPHSTGGLKQEDRVNLPGPMKRRGPRPLALHLMAAAARSNGLANGSTDWNRVWKACCGSGSGVPPPPFEDGDAIRSVATSDKALITGIAAYRRHSSQRALDDPPSVWREGSIRLIDYAPSVTGQPVVFVPSLVNRGYILDLAPGHSMLRYLAAQGIRPLLLDWGWPGDLERSYTLTDYIVGPLERAITSLGRPVTLVGYCMGGLLALAAAQRRPDLVAALGLLATPWDFHATNQLLSEALAAALPWVNYSLQAGHPVPVDMLQAAFAMVDPLVVAERYRRFGRIDQQSARAAMFVAVEDWANDGVPLPAAVARDCFDGWYGANSPVLGQWQVAGMAVVPQSLVQSCFAAIPRRDRIVPPESAWSLVRCLQRVEVVEPIAGHVGMVAGSSAEGELWRPMLIWLQSLDQVGLAA